MSLYFVETAAFTRRLGALGLESELSALQSTLAGNVAAGDIDPGTGGLRKLRLVFVYGKDEQSTLTPLQKRQLKRVAEALRAEWDTNTGEAAV